jgi:mono/diheme cytochrome c family protein
MDLCDDPAASGIVGIRKAPGPGGTTMFGVACAACHAGYDPVRPPADPNEPDWSNIHATIGNQHLKVGAIFSANLAPTDPRALMFAAWPDGAVDTTLLFNDNIMNPGVITAFWEHTNRATFDVGMDVEKLRNGQGGEDDVGGDLAALRVYTNIGVCFQECVAGPAVTGVPIDIDTCRAACPDFPPQSDLDDMGAFLASFRAPQYTAWRELRLSKFFAGSRVFAAECASCHANDRELRTVLSNDEVIPLAEDPDNNTNACRALTSNWEEGKIWAQFSSQVYKDRVAAGDRGYRVMPLGGVWATAPFLHNQSVGGYADPTASIRARGANYEGAMRELLSRDRGLKVNALPFDLGPFAAGTPLTYVFSRDPATNALLCNDPVENGGHYYGADLSDADKEALIHYVKFQ